MNTVIHIAGRDYVEKKPGPTATGEVCSQCAFGLGRLGQCAEAVQNSPKVFGGDCAERDVVYAEAPEAA